MGLCAGGALKKHIRARFPAAVVAAIPPGLRVVVDLDARWIPFVCTSESIDDLRAVARKFLAMLAAYEPSEVVLACESAGVPVRKRAVQEKRAGEGLDPRSRAEFERQWAHPDAVTYSTIASAAGKEMGARQISCALLTDRDVRRVLRDDFLAKLRAEHREQALAWPLSVHGNTLLRQDGRETPVEGYNPGEGEFKFGHYLDGAPPLATTKDTDALAVTLCGLPPAPPPATHFLELGDLRLDAGVLRRQFATRGALDAWLLGWVMGGTDYLANPPKLGLVSIQRGVERYADVLRGAIRYRGPVALLDADRAVQYWYLLRRVPWLVSDQKKNDPRGAAIAAILGGDGDPERRMADALELAGAGGYDEFRAAHAALAADLAWNVRYFWGAGLVPPEE